MEFLGYERPDRSVGVRNYVALIPAVRCANELTDRIADEVGPGAVALLHTYHCVNLKPDNEKALRALVGLGANPNVAATIVVGIGCDALPTQEIAEGISRSRKPVEVVTIDREGSYEAAYEKGVGIAKGMLAQASLLQRQRFDMSHLVFGTKCTGSTPASIVACNPTVGWAIDRIIAEGGSAIFSETTEIIGAEHILARRAATQETASRIYEVADRMERRILESGIDVRGSQPNPGNIRGGMSTLEEKSLGAVAKSGSSPLQDVLEWAEKVPGKGLYFMDGTANTPQVFVGLAAAGAQILSLNYGGGLPARFHNFTAANGGLPVVPVLKVLSSPQDRQEMEYFDVYAGTIIEGHETVTDTGQRMLEEILAVASGKPTKQELYSRYREPLDMYQTGPIL